MDDITEYEAIFEQPDEVLAATAEDYVRRTGNRGPRFIAGLWEKLRSGKSLTEAQQDQVLISQHGEVRASRFAVKRIAAEETKAAKVLDINRVFIGDDVTDGTYAVESKAGGIVLLKVERPKKGVLRGFITVNAIVGEGVEKWGVQYPQPWRVENPNHRQFYRGVMAHLVAQLVDNPTAARERAEVLEVAA